jgi:integrase
MASIRLRNGKWQAQIRRQGYPNLSKSFIHKSDATTWARQMEVAADRHDLPVDPRILTRTTVGDLIILYRDTITPSKRGRENETIILNALLRQNFTKITLTEITSKDFSAYRDRRYKKVKSTTIRRELSLLQHAFRLARDEWGIPVSSNPLATIKRPPQDKARDRRLEDGEEERLIAGCHLGRSLMMAPLIKLALETGMRRGELLNIRHQDINIGKRTLHIPQTKNGHARTIPLSSGALEVISTTKIPNDGFFPMSGNAVRLAWSRLTKRMGIEDLHFHDLRHEAVSRFFEMGLSMPEVALISGHRDPRMLFRYTHLRAEDVAKKLND